MMKIKIKKTYSIAKAVDFEKEIELSQQEVDDLNDRIKHEGYDEDDILDYLYDEHFEKLEQSIEEQYPDCDYESIDGDFKIEHDFKPYESTCCDKYDYYNYCPICGKKLNND